MNSVGIDLHRKRSHIAVIDETGEQLLSRRIVNDPRDVPGAAGRPGGRAHGSRGGDLRLGVAGRVLEDAGYELHLAHPMRTKAIASARVKTDAVDARTLAHLLRADLLPEAYIAPRELRDLRELLRHRVALTRMRTALKNRVHARSWPSTASSTSHSDLFGRGGARSWPSSSCARARAGGWTACSR